MIPSIRQTPLRVLFLAIAVAVVGLMTVPNLPSASTVHAQEQQVTTTRDATGENPPTHPTNLQTSAEPNSVSLTWTASTDQSVTHYAVLRRDRNENDADVFHVIDSNAGPGISYTDDSVSPEGSYVYRVKAVSPTGVSQWSNYAGADAPADPADLAPSNLTARPVAGPEAEPAGVELVWDAPAEDAASVTGYEILRAQGDGEMATLVADTGSTATTHTDATATAAGESYAYRVKALRGEEASQFSNQAWVFIPKVTVVGPHGELGDRRVQPEFRRGAVYTWYDGDRPIRVVLQNDVNVRDDPQSADYAARGAGDALQPDDDDLAKEKPVFRPESGGEPMTLPGGVLLLLEPELARTQIDAFFSRNDIPKNRFGAIEGLTNTFLVETAPGFPSFNLANQLVGQDEVVASSPNWGLKLDARTGRGDLHGDTRDTATDLPLDTDIFSYLEAGDDVDFFKIVLSEETDFTVVCALCEQILTLFAADGMELQTGVGALPETTRAAGEYYVKVSAGSGEDSRYRLFVQSHDPGSTDALATDLALGRRVETVLYPKGDADVYKVLLTETTRLLIDFDRSGTFTVSNASDEVVVERKPAYSIVDDSFDAGTYYVNVGGESDSEGFYELLVAPITEQSNSSTGAQSLTLGQTVYGEIKGTDIDWFEIDLGEPTEVSLLLESTIQSIHQAEVFNETGTLIRGHIRDYLLPMGTSYVKVSHNEREFGENQSTSYFGLTLKRNTDYEAFIEKCSGLQTAYSDPLFGCQWHLSNTDANVGTPGEDIGIGDVWDTYTGEGVRVTVVDDAVDAAHEDLTGNVDESRSWRASGTSYFDSFTVESSHGTSVAGIIAARNNLVGVRGVAPRATLQSHDLLRNPTTANVVLATIRNSDVTAVSSNSWGFPGVGLTHASRFWGLAVTSGIASGYFDRGTVYVLAAGNSHELGEHTNASEQLTHHGVVVVCAVDENGRRAPYSETGANLWVCAPAAIVTTANASRYREDFEGTSAAAPVVSGVVALMRQANPALTWRDVKLILAASARENDSSNGGWQDGALKYRSVSQTDRYSFNHEYGFGVVQAEAAVELAEDWVNLPPMRTASASSADASITIPNPVAGTEPTTVSNSIEMDTDIDFIEFVEIDVSFADSSFRTLDIELVAPSGAVSTLSFSDLTYFVPLYGRFRFASAKHLGEDPSGRWTLRVTDRYAGSEPSGVLRQWSVTVYGHSSPPSAPAIESAATDSGSLAVVWSASTDPGGTPVMAYDLRYIRSAAADKSDANWTKLRQAWTAGSLRFRISRLSNGVSYDLQVRAINTDGPGPWSATVTGTPLATALVPVIESITLGDTSLTVSWTTPTDTGSSTITAYDLRYIQSDALDKGDTHWTVLTGVGTVSSLETSVPTLVNGVEYDVQVRAVFGADNGTWSATHWGTPATTPGAPLITIAIPGDGALTVGWTAPAADGGAPITSYHLRHLLSDEPDKSDANWTEDALAWTSGQLRSVVTDLTSGSGYDVQMRAANAAGSGPWSATHTATPGATPGAPSRVGLLERDGALLVAWAPPLRSGGIDVSSYDVRYIRSSAADKTNANWNVRTGVVTSLDANFDDPEFVITGLTNAFEYDVQVSAVNAVGRGAWSDTRVHLPWSPDVKPTLTDVIPGNGSLTVRWDPPPPTVGAATLASWQVWVFPAEGILDSGVFFVNAPDSRQFVVDFLVVNGVEYTVAVTAVYFTASGGELQTAFSNELTATPRTVPGEATIDSVFADNEELLIAFTAPADDGGSAVSAYDLRHIRSDATDKSDANWTVLEDIWTSGDLSFRVDGLTNGVGYDAQIRAVNAAGDGPWSPTSSGTPTALSDMATLTDLTLTGVRLTPGFTSGVTSYAGAVGYTVSRTTVVATSSDTNAAVVIIDGNGNTLAGVGMADLDLSVGENVFQVRVTAQDGVAIETYTVTVTRTGQDLSLTPPVSAPVAAFASTAVYTVEFRGDWTTAVTPDGVPGGAHFSRLIAAVHDAGVTFLESGEAASPGVESMAEIGGTSILRSEVTGAGANALGVVQGDTSSIGPTATNSLTVTLTTGHPLVTLVTMIAPSPDWFIGVSGLSLLDPGGNWLSSHEVQLYPWDAGTENGDEFSLSNPATSPRGVITSIRGTGKFSTESIATLTFTLESVNLTPTGAPFITGAPEVGEELTAHTSAIADADGLTSPGYSYRWLRVDSGGQAVDISGATSDTYTVQAADVGKRLAVRVSFTDDEDNGETLTGDPTEAVIVAQVTVSFEATAYQAEEGSQGATVRVVLDKEPHRTLVIPLHDAPGGGAGPSDYTAPSQVTFGPGETGKDAPVSATDDSVDDDGESVTLSFGDLPDGVSAGSPPETVVQIVDNDYVPVTLEWEETAFTAEEPTSPGALTPVTLRAVAITATDKRPESDFSFDFTVNTANGTARQPGDYERLSTTGTFDRSDFFRTTVNGQFRWVASADFTVNVVHDTVDEPSESFTVRLAFAGSRQPHLTLGDSTATVTTTDDVASLADLFTTVFAGSSAVEPGGQLTYDWSVGNSGPAASTNTVLTATLDAAVTFVSAQVTSPATGQCRRSGRTVTCTFGTLELGGTVSGEIVVEVEDDASADIRFSANAAADQLDRTPADNSESVTTALYAAPLQITDLRATAAGEHIDLAWSAPVDNGSAISRYELERRTGTTGFVPVVPSPQTGATSHRDEDVEEGVGYTYRLRAVNDDAAAGWSNEATATVDVNEPPEFTSSSRAKTSFDYPENRTSALYTYKASDPEGGAIAWSLSGEDRDDFSISETGMLSFAQVPDFEFPADADRNNEYLVTVEARDDRSNVARLEVTVNVTNAAGAEEPTIATTSRSSLTFRENGTGTIYTYRATDPQGGAISWSVTGTDADDFTIGSGGELTFTSPPDFEVPTDADGDNVYELAVVATDKQGLTDSVDVTVTVTNDAEGVEPTISTRRPPSTYRENGTSAVYTFRASDPQRQTITWSLDGADRGGFTFTADSSGRAVLAFSTSPDFEVPADSDSRNDYELTVIATDEDGHADRLSFTVAVTDVNEGPEISRVGSAPGSVPENYDLVLARYSATDPEGVTVAQWRTSGTDGGDFVIDEQGELRFRNTPDHERPADSNLDNVYVFTVQASDGRVYGSFEETVTVTPVNEAPAITTTGGSATDLRQDENRTSRLYTYRATDPERETFTWSVGGADGHLFAIDERGQFSFRETSPPDFEQPGDLDGNNVYEVEIQATDDGLNTASLPVTVTVREVNEGPEVTGRTGFTIFENQDLAGAAYTAVDPEDPGGVMIRWSLTGRDAGDFTIDESGLLAFRNVVDYERPADSGRDNVYEVTVRASDGRNYGHLEVTVTVEDVNEPPTVTGTDTFAFRENDTAILHTFRATDPEGSDVTWSVSGQDGGHFAVYQGMLTLKRIPNFESPVDDDGDNVYEVTVVARDDAFNSGTLDVTVTVSDQNEGPEISGLQSLSFTENQATDRVLATYTAVDPENPGVSTMNWSLTGHDAGDFTIDESGRLTFRKVPDHERPADSGRDNMYEVTVRASDGRHYGYLEVTVTVEDVNEAPAVTGTETFTYRENGTATLHTFRAADPERSVPTWSLQGPDDDHFTIGETDVLSFASPPDHESPADSGRDNVYEVTVVARDDSFNSGTLDVTVTVTDQNEGPEITGVQTLSFTENQATDRVLAFYSAADPEDPGAAITRWSVTGRDAGDFAIDENGRLTFRNVPDYEKPADSGRDNVYNLSVRASDGRYYGYLEVTVTVEAVNEGPAVTGTETFNYRENGTADLYTFRATDPEGSAVTWSLSGADEDDFAIGETGVLAFARSPDYEGPTDSDGDNVYEVTVVARDDAFNSGTLDVVVTVTYQDEGPEITGVQGLSFTENQATDRVLATYTGRDPEEPSALITLWSLTGHDAGDFRIDESGRLTFRSVPDYEKPADSRRDNIYEVTVRASDGRNYGYLEVTVTVEDVNESPSVTGTETFTYRENGTAMLHAFRAADPERSAIEWSLSGPDDDDFSIGENGVLSFAGPPDHESPSDSGRDNVYNVTIVARDDAFNSGTLDVTVTVTDQNEGPEVSGVQSLSFTENQATDRALAFYTGRDPEEPGAAITRWSVTGRDAGDFAIDESGRLTFRNVPDYEKPADSGRDNVYNLSVRASDGRYYGYLEVTVTVEDVNEPPAVTGTETFNYRENGTANLYTFRATDPERGAVTWSLSGADEDDFAIGETGVLSFAGPPDYENAADSGRDNVYEVTVEARDDAFNTGTLDVVVTVIDVNEGPEITGSVSLSFTENQATDRALAFYSATDPEEPSALITRWSLTGRDAGDFAIDENGQLTFRSVPDYERPADSGRDNMYEVTVRASDGRYYGYFEVTVTVEDVNEPPLVTGTETFNYRENGTATLHAFRAADPERGAVTWSLSRADASYFTIGDNGVLSFASPPDHESPTDSGRDNLYEVTIVARDDAFNSGTLDVAVNVTDVNEGPEITGRQTLSFTENQATDRVLAFYSATDPEDPSASITRWSLSGTDRGDFTINESGELTFRNVPDHEKPADSGRDNVYNLSVRASDGRNYGYLEVTVTVEDVNEAPAVTGTETFSYRENGTAAVYTFRATDPEGSVITWSLSGSDDGDFTIGETGVLFFASPPEYESPADSNGDNVYDVTIVARDDAFNSGTLDITITVTDQNEGPEISGQQGLSFTENQATDRVLASYTATDPEDPSALITSWSLTGRDAGDFRIDENGRLTFRNVPDYERPADSGKDNEYNFSVRASDGRYYGYLVVTVTVQDVNEAPAITTTGKTAFSYRENDTATIYTFKATDPERGTIEWSTSGADGSDFTIEDGALKFTSPPSFESPQGSGLDGNEYLVTVQVRDDDFNTSSLSVTVTVTDRNEGPEITGQQSLSFTENQATDRVLATYSARDPEDPSADITRWSLSGADAGDFTIDEGGRLAFRNIPDHEKPADSGRDNVYNLSIRASDGRNYGYLEVTVTVQDVNEAPSISASSKTAFTYRENGTATIYTFKASDPERGTIEWSVTGTDGNYFAISETGVLYFTGPPDYESPADSGLDNVYEVTVAARDDAFNSDTLDVTVTVTDQNEGPEITGQQSLSFTENQATDRALAFYSATDPEDPFASITRWSLTGTDAGDFTIDESGRLTFRNVPDYERPADSGRDNVYNLSVRASDGRNYGYLEVTVTVEDVNEAPAVTGTETFSYRENGTAAVYTFRAADPEGSVITWSLSGADDGDFTIGETGVLSFASPPDYEIPGDSGGDNVYEVTVVARDDFFNSGTLDVTVTVTDVNEGPEIAGQQSLSFTENQATDRVLASYTATDPEDSSALITRWSVTGTDAGDFTIDENGRLTFRNVPDYEKPADSGRDNVYEVTVRASDGRYYGYLEATVTVEDVNEAPAISASTKTAFTYRENGTAAIYTFKATDPEGSAITWSLSGTDDGDFAISETGVLSFAISPDYEIPADSDSDNVYDVTVVARDDAFNSGTLDVTVTVTDLNEGPEIAGQQTLSFTENQATDRVLAFYSATDPEDPSASITRWSLTGPDGGDFTIDENGQLTFRNVPDYEKPADSGRDNVYNLSVRAYDGRNYGYLEVAVTVQDVNEAPAISASSKTAFTYRESGTATIYTFKATDPERGTITWSLSGADNDDFAISETGVLSFAISPDYESPADSGRDNVYEVTVEARDDFFNSGTLDITVTVTDLNEGPEITGQQTLSFTENQATDRVLATYSATDPEDTGAAITRWSLTGPDAGDFTINENGQLTFRNVPDYEKPADSGRDNVYNLSVRASDGRNYGYLEVTVTVQDVNEAPAISASSKTEFTYRENGTATIYTFKATDPEKGVITWSLSGADNDDFAISETGVLSFASSPDYEIPTDSDSDNVYEVTVVARDDFFNSGTLDVTVTVTDQNEGPEITGQQSLSFTENQATDRVLASYSATDPEDPSALITRWSLTGRDAGDFTINESGELTFRNVPDYERPADSGGDNVYNLSVRASDGRNYGYLEVTVTVEAVNEPPAVTGTTSFTYRENGTATLHTFRATDPERSSITWSLSGADNDDFAISETGVLSFANPPDYEIPGDSGGENVYEVTVVARDDFFNSGTLDVTVTVTDVNEGPEIAGQQSLSFTENQATDRVLATYSATDPENPSVSITRWSVTGTDAGDFNIDENGRLTFRNVPDHEKPADSGRDNVYNFSVRASDGRYYGYLEVTVTVEAVNEPPVITGADTLSYKENGTATLHTFRATDPERSAITWSLSGADASDFTISDTGVLAFAVPPDYENPTDSGRDNVYEVTVEARDDDFNTGRIEITITVVNLTD